jgi:hypothetical protein
VDRPIDTPLYPYRSKADRRRDVIAVMEASPEISDRRIARIAGVSRELVGQIRRELVRLSLIQSHHALRRVGADGKTYELPRPKQN